MKKIFTTLFFVALFCSTNASNTYNLPVDSTVNIIVGFTKNNANTKLNDVKEFIKSISGVNSVLFCDNHSALIINLNQSLIIYNKESFINQIIAVFPQDSFIMKGSASEILPYCTFNDAMDAQIIKSN
ncbi:MAG: hypothetical protein IPJ32_01715 [Sphingobacteriaceae bacterium]|nr:hypothetical protein [Sphingobacteriaceae bacterium]